MLRRRSLPCSRALALLLGPTLSCTAASQRPTDEAAAATSRPASEAAAPAPPPELRTCLGLAALDASTATATAQAAGLKAAIYVPEPVLCPELRGRAPGTRNPLAATGPLAPLLVDLDAFLRPEVGVAEAIALLGPPVLCSNSYARFLDVHVAPRDANVRDASFVLDDGELIDLRVAFAAPVEIDIGELTRRFGAAKRGLLGPHATDPPDDIFQIEGSDFGAQAIIGTTEREAPPGKRRVRQLILRRFPRADALPSTFEAEADLVALAAYALRARPVDAHKFFGTLGVSRGPGVGEVDLEQVVARNLRSARVETDLGPPHDTRALSVTLQDLVAASPEPLASAVAKALDLPAPAVERQREGARITVSDRDGRVRGEVVLELREDRVKAMTVRRLDLSHETSALDGYPLARLRVEANPVEPLDLPLDAAALAARGVRSYRAFSATAPRVWLLVFERSGDAPEDEVLRRLGELLPADRPPFSRQSTSTGAWRA